MAIKSFLNIEIYKTTSSFPNQELYGVTSQIRKASASIPTNISEDCGRNSDKEFNQFLILQLVLHAKLDIYSFFQKI